MTRHDATRLAETRHFFMNHLTPTDCIALAIVSFGVLGWNFHGPLKGCNAMSTRLVPDELLSIEAAAAALGISHNRLLNWMENNEWLFIGDTSFDVVWGQVEAGNLAVAKSGGVKITAQGMSEIHKRFPADKPHGSEIVGESIPF